MHNIIIHEIEQATMEWFNLRVGMVTSSRFNEIIKNGKGEQESKCKLTLIDSLTTEILINQKLDFAQTFAMRQGIEREAEAKKAYEAITFNTIRKAGFIQIEDKYIGCSPDGLIGDDGGIEIKCPEPKAHFENLKSNSVPEKYIAQIQGCMWITNRKWWDFISYNPDFLEHLQIKIVRMYRDENIIDKISQHAYQVEGVIRNQVKQFLEAK